MRTKPYVMMALLTATASLAAHWLFADTWSAWVATGLIIAVLVAFITIAERWLVSPLRHSAKRLRESHLTHVPEGIPWTTTIEETAAELVDKSEETEQNIRNLDRATQLVRRTSRLFHAKDGETEAGVRDLLAELGQLAGQDCTMVSACNAETGELVGERWWPAGHKTDSTTILDPWLLTRLKASGFVDIPTLDSIPDQAESLHKMLTDLGMESAAFAISDRSGRGTTVLAVMSNTTRPPFEDARREIIRALTEVVCGLYCHAIVKRKLKEAKRETDMVQRTRNRFLNTVSHALRTPMNSLTGMAEIALSTELTPDQRHYLRVIHSSARIFTGIMDDALDLVQVDANRLVLAEEDFRVMETAEIALDTVAHEVAARGIEAFCQVSPNVPTYVRGDSRRFLRILSNLLNESVSLTDHGHALLRIDVSPNEQPLGEDHQIILNISLRFTGSAVASKNGSRIDEVGTGITGVLIQRMGGSFSVEGTTEQGQFDLTLPFSQPTEHTSDMPPATSLPPQKTVLVSRNDSLRRIVRSMLTDWEFEVLDVGSPTRAFALLEQEAEDDNPAEIIILDLSAEDPQIIGMVEQLVTDPVYRNPAIVAISPVSLAADQPRYHDAGCGGFVIKPVRQSHLYAEIAAAMRLKAGFPRIDAHRRAGPITDHQLLARGGRILVVEDNPTNQQVADLILRGAGHTVLLASDGLKALDMLRDTVPDAILMDLQLPRLNGYETARRIRADDRLRDVPIIAMTAHVMVENRQRCREAGMNDYIPKPITRESILGTVHRWLTSTHESADVESSEPLVDEPVMPVFDPLPLAGITGGDHEALGLMITSFLKNTEGHIQHMQRAGAERDIATVQRLSHSLIGSVATYGARRLHVAIRSLNNACKSNDCTEVQVLMDKVNDEWNDLREELQNILSPGD
jgi:CheY-like chemotaxis protein/HPt (histidine-containing phosphotransfer) domain-containing protein